jgi:murein DD-endopeptidase MepM/ murein hydrolase activator NlpD
MQQPPFEEPPEVPGARSIFNLRRVLIVLITAIAIPFAVVGWLVVYRSHLEFTRPSIVLSEVPRGIGLAPVSLKLEITDSGTGLSDVQVRVKQRAWSKDLVRRALTGQREFRIEIPLDGKELELDELKKVVEVEIRAVDASLWGNTAQVTMPLSVDFRKPKVELLTPLRAMRPGDSQLLFYRALDENLAYSGIKLGNKTFEGIRASGIDRDFSDSRLYAVLFALDARETHGRDSPVVRIFAEDIVGNADAAPLALKLAAEPAAPIEHSIEVDDELLRGVVAPLVEQNLKEVQALLGDAFQGYKTRTGSDERLLEQFKLLNQEVAIIADNAIEFTLKKSALGERLFLESLLLPKGKLAIRFGERAVYRRGALELGRSFSTGYEFATGKTGQEVIAANEGIVVLSDNLGAYGRVLAIDHGLGLHSVYGRLDSVTVSVGTRVARGQEIGTSGSSGLARFAQCYFELRVQGVPVRAENWADPGWYHGAITERVNQVRGLEGLPVFERPL